MILFLLSLELSIGAGVDFTGDYRFNRDGWKGIIQIEQPLAYNFTCGFWHSSELDNGFKGNHHDENIGYIKYKYVFNF